MKDIICLTLGDFEENCYLFAYRDRLCVVDPGDDSSALIHEIDKVCNDNALTFSSVYLTHGHLDHVAGINRLKKIYPDIQIYIGERDKNCLGPGSYNFQYESFSSVGLGGFVKKMLYDEQDLIKPDFCVHDGSYIFGDWKVIATPGHTRGSTCLYNESRKLLFTGDTMMFYSFGRTDMLGGSETEIYESLNELLKLPSDTIVCPGHENYGFELGKAFLWSFIGIQSSV